MSRKKGAESKDVRMTITPVFERGIFKALAEVVSANRSLTGRRWVNYIMGGGFLKILIFRYNRGHDPFFDKIVRSLDGMYMVWLAKEVKNRGRSVLENKTSYVYVYKEGSIYAATFFDKALFKRMFPEEKHLERVLSII